MSESHFDWFLTDRFGKTYHFDKSKIILGRKDCDIQLKSNSVDYKHCILFINDKDNHLKIKDLETANGTFINEKQIKPNYFKLLNIGDKIRLAYDQITFTVQKKTSLNITSSPSRGTDLPSVVTDPERFMPPVVCELTDSTIDLNSPVKENAIPLTENINGNTENMSPVESPVNNLEYDASTDFSYTSNIQSKPSESFTIDFTNNGTNDGDSSSVGLSKFMPSKLRSSFEGRDKVVKKRIQTSSSFNKADNLKTENKTIIKLAKANTFNKGKLTTKPDETPIKPKPFAPKKNPEKVIKVKPNASPKTSVRQIKAANELRDKKLGSEIRDKKFSSESQDKKFTNEGRDKKNAKTIINNSKNVTPTLNRKNSKSYLFEKMLMGTESTIDFMDYDERNKDAVEVIPEPNLQINPVSNIVLPIIDDVPIPVKNNQDVTDAASEAGTYVIENEKANEKAASTDGTLEEDDNSSVSSIHFNLQNLSVKRKDNTEKPKIMPDQELESKSSAKWLSEFPTDDTLVDMDGKSKRNQTTKFTVCSMPHIPTDISAESEKSKTYRDDENPKLNTNCMINDMRTRNTRGPSYNTGDPNNNLNADETKNWNANGSDSNRKPGNTAKNNFQPSQQIPISPYAMGNQSLLVSEDVYVSDVITNSTVPTNNYSRASNLPQKSKEMDLFSTLNFSSTQSTSNYHPRPTYSVASLDTALLLQDTEALLNDMEKRVYSRREIKTTEEFSRIQPFSTSFSQSEKIPYVDDGEEREEDTSLFNYSTEIEEGTRLAAMKLQTSLSNHNDSAITEDKNRSYNLRSPITSGIIRRNNSCKVGVSETLGAQSNIVGRKLNSTIRNQRSCSLIEERKSNHNNNNIETFTDYRNKPKLSLLAMNSGTYNNRRGSGGGYSSALNSPITKFEPISVFNSSFPNQKSKDPVPYLSNMLSVHRQKFNRYEYGQHSLKYNSNSTTMLYNKYNNTSPPWNGEDSNNLNHNSVYPNYDADYYSYNTMPEPIEASMLFLKHEPSIIENMHHQQLNIDSNTDPDYQRREDIIEYTQPGNISGRSSAFSPVNSLHQSTESVNNFQITNKSKSSLGLNEQRSCNYDFLLVSSIHLYSARLCRYTEEIVHRLRREDPDYKASSPIESNAEQSDTFGQLKSANRELQETLNNMRSLEKQLQKIEKAVFPPEKSGRNSALGSCTEDSYLNQLERINKELEDFVPIDDEKTSVNKTTASVKPSTRTDYSFSNDSKPTCQITISKSQQSMDKSKNKLDQSKNSYSTIEICSPTKSKYSSLSKRFQLHKD